tara:strand:- start:31 stop:555 length:525 start_codon:yes stop_codon:yes gene_type:complete
MASILKVNTIQDATNSNTAISVDSSGRVTTPARPFFHVYVDNGGSNVTSGSGTDLVQFDGVVSNVGSHFNATSSGNGYSFTAPVAGIYQFNWNLSIYGISSGNWLRQRVYKNGSSLQIHGYLDIQTTDDQNINSAFSLLLSANDYIQFYANSQVSTFYYSAGTTWNTCTGYLVG